MFMYLRRVLIAFDVFLNVLAGGMEDETISSRCARIAATHKRFSWNPGVILAIWINNLLLFIAYHHGLHAEQSDYARAEAVAQVEAEALTPEK